MGWGHFHGGLDAAERLMNASVGLRRLWGYERRPGSRQFGGLQGLSSSGIRSVHWCSLLLELH